MPEEYPSRDKTKQCWYRFIQGGRADGEVREAVLTSWKRCRAGGISPYLTAANKVDETELERRLAANQTLINTAEPMIRHLYKFLAGSGFVVALSDHRGIILFALGDDDAIKASNGNLVPGADWSELGVGTNSVGTTLCDDAPTQYWGYEHYCRLPQRWAGSGAPIHDSEGVLVGCLNISGEIARSHLHTLGMVVITAQAIEMQLRLTAAIGNVEHANQHQEAIIGAISEGLVILDENGLISLANPWVEKRLKTVVDGLLGHPIGDLCQDRNLLKIITAGGEITDYITELTFNNEGYACTVTCRTIPRELGKPELLLLINDILRAKKLARRLSASEAVLTFRDIIGEDKRLRSVINVAIAAAETSANVLILGESGTGKEVFAQAIHSGSPRADGPFIAINCAAIPRELVASTLFGYEEGAFTGAKRGGSPGKFELADHGTLFLDEIGELPLDIQAVLLRVLETKSFTRVGGKDNISVDVRIIAATNRDLLYESQTNQFRQDLYYRLNVFSLSLTPLRERRDDIPLLANHFLAQMNRRYERSIGGFSEEALRLLTGHDWPGNIRELQNAMERMVVMTAEHTIQQQTVALALPAAAKASHVETRAEWPHLIRESGADGEREQLVCLLEECRWNISKAAVRLGVARSTLYRKIYYYGLKQGE